MSDEKKDNNSVKSLRVIRQGFLYKRSKNLRVFRKRWVVLTPKHLYCFKNKKDKQLTEKFNISNKDIKVTLTNNGKIELDVAVDVKHTQRQFNSDNNTNLYWVKDIQYAQSLSLKKQPWICHLCQFVNPWEKDKCQQCEEKIFVNIPIATCQDFDNMKLLVNSKFVTSISVQYISTITIQDILNKVTEEINKKSYPKIYYICNIGDISFTKEGVTHPWYFQKRSMRSVHNPLNTFHDNNDAVWDHWNAFCSKHVTDFDKFLIEERGLFIKIYNIVTHKIKDNNITCQYIINKKYNPLNCPIYKSMKLEYKYTDVGYKHLTEFIHFKDEYNEKPDCRHYAQCRAFIRLENGGNRLDDKCHIKLFKHPPRSDRQIRLSQNMKSFLVNTDRNQNYPIYQATDFDKIKYKWNKIDGFINALIFEVIENGFKNDLCLYCSSNDAECKHNNHSLLKIVDYKMNHLRHKQMNNPLTRGMMLAFILYTGCDCNYDLCSNQRQKNYQKWKWFDALLFNGIDALSHREKGSYSLYSGLKAVNLKKKIMLNCYFTTYTSTSWIKNISKTFMGDKGMIIEIDKEMRDILKCCDVSWISKFTDECEVLIARSDNQLFSLDSIHNNNKFKVSILDQHNGIQTVSLSKNIKDTNIDHNRS